MNRTRWIALVSACVLTAAGALVLVPMGDGPKASVNLSVGSSDTDDTVELPELPLDDEETTTTSDLGALVPSPTTSTTRGSGGDGVTGPSTTTTTTRVFDPKKSYVVATNKVPTPLLVWVGTNQKVLQPNESIEWVLPQSDTPVSGGVSAYEAHGNCETKFAQNTSLAPGRLHAMEIVLSGAHCESGAYMPRIRLTDTTTKQAKTFDGGLVPDATHALLWVESYMQEPMTLTVIDDANKQWLLPATTTRHREAPFLLAVSNEHGDSITVGYTDPAQVGCGYGDGEDYFKAGHEYRVVVDRGDGAKCEGGSFRPNVILFDMTDGSKRAIDPSNYHPLPTTG